MKKLLVALIIVSSIHASKEKKNPATLEQLWASTATWMREYLVDVCADLPGQKMAKQQLMKHQELLGRSLSPYYGDKVAQEFTKLLKEQGRLTINLIDAANKANKKALKEAQTAWKANACSLSTLLSQTNPYITFQVLRNLLNEYLSQLVAMFTSRTHKKWEEDSEAYEKVRAQNALIAQLFSQAIADAFPPAHKKKPLKAKPQVALILPPGTSIKP